MPPKMSMMLDVEDVDEGASFSTTWSIDPTGTLRHKQTGTKISADSGITFSGQEYKLSPADIELEDKHLGAGAGGVVIRGIIKSTGQRIAVKTVKVDDKAKRDQLLKEIHGLVSGQGCPYIVDWYAGFVNKKTNAVHVALEYMDLGSLRDLHKRSPNGQVHSVYLATISFQVLQGLHFLHTAVKFLHRDIKPENILHNTAGEVKLTDFGIAKDLDCTLAMAGTFVGTATYMSPERCLGNEYDFASDIWSAGMVIHELASGRYPFSDCVSFPALFQQLCDDPEPRLDVSLGYSPALVEFAGYCLTRDVSKRPDSEWLLQHPWMGEAVSVEDLAVFFATLMREGDN